MLGNGYRHCIDLEPAQSGADDYGRIIMIKLMSLIASSQV